MRSRGQRAGQFLFALLLTGLLALSTGCASVRKPDRAQTESVRKSEKAFVLLRAVRTENGAEPLVATKFHASLWQLDAADGRIVPTPKRLSPSWKAPSRAALTNGWRYVTVEPGNYYLELTPEMPDYRKKPKTQCLYLSVPPGKPLVYAGTILWDRTVTTNSPGNKDVAASMDALRDESVLAQAAAAEALPESGEPATGVVVPYGDLERVLGDVGDRSVAVTNLASVGKPQLDGSSSQPAEIASAVFFFPGLGLFYAAGAGGQGASGDAAVGVLVVAGCGMALMVVAVPIYGVVYGVTRGIHEIGWGPYEKAYVGELAAYGLEPRLTKAVTSSLGASAMISTNDRSPFVLRLQPYRVFLRGNSDQKFSPEIAVAAWLIDSETGKIACQNRFVYRQPPDNSLDSLVFGHDSLAPFESFVPGPRKPRRLKEYQGEAGRQAFQSDFNEAVENLTGEITRWLRQARLGTRPADAETRH